MPWAAHTPRIAPRAYAAAQALGAILGVWAAHGMFDEPIWQVSTRLRDGPARAGSEALATFGLVLTILGVRARPQFTAAVVGLYIAAAYWFTASTSFANPAVTVARSLSGTFAGVAPVSVPAFLAAQITGALAAAGVCGWLFPTGRGAPSSDDQARRQEGVEDFHPPAGDRHPQHDPG